MYSGSHGASSPNRVRTTLSLCQPSETVDIANNYLSWSDDVPSTWEWAYTLSHSSIVFTLTGGQAREGLSDDEEDKIDESLAYRLLSREEIKLPIITNMEPGVRVFVLTQEYVRRNPHTKFTPSWENRTMIQLIPVRHCGWCLHSTNLCHAIRTVPVIWWRSVTNNVTSRWLIFLASRNYCIKSLVYPRISGIRARKNWTEDAPFSRYGNFHPRSRWDGRTYPNTHVPAARKIHLHTLSLQWPRKFFVPSSTTNLFATCMRNISPRRVHGKTLPSITKSSSTAS